MRLCKACGKQNREQARFCGYCGRPLPAPTPEPTKEGKKLLLGTRTYAVLAAIGWLTLFTPFVTLRACGTQQNLSGTDWIALQHGEGKKHLLPEKTLRNGKVPTPTSLEAVLEGLVKMGEAQLEREIDKALAETCREAPFYFRPFLAVDPIPEASYLLFVLILGLAWLQWYRPVDWLCLAGVVLCLHTILNVYLHQRLFAQKAFPFGVVEIAPGWGLFALISLWGILYALNHLQRWAGAK
jgi:hypothetical protein